MTSAAATCPLGASTDLPERSCPWDGQPGMWPRPRNTDGLPTVYVSIDPDEPEGTDSGRTETAWRVGLCQVCGGALAVGDCFLVVSFDRAAGLSDGAILEGPGLHGRCLRLSRAFCAPLRDMLYPTSTGPMRAQVYALDPAVLIHTAGIALMKVPDPSWEDVMDAASGLDLPVTQVDPDNVRAHRT